MKKELPLRVKIDINLLKKYAEEGLFCYQISELMDTSRSTIETHAKRNSITLKTNKDSLIEKEKEIIELLNSGKTVKEVRRSGYCYEFIKKIAAKNNITTGTHQSAAQKKILPINEVIRKIKDTHKGTIEIIAESYLGTNKHATFIDKEYGEFVNIVGKVLTGQRHPERARITSSQEQAQFITSSGESIRQLAARTGMSYVHMLNIAQDDGLQALEDWISAYKDNTSSLELKMMRVDFGENVTCKHLGKKSCPEVKKMPRKGDKKINKFWRPDFKIINNLTGKSIYVDTDGLSTHSELRKPDKRYHMKKREDYDAQGLDLLQIRQDELVFNKAIVRSLIRYKIGIFDKKLHARKLQVKVVDRVDISSFLKANHLMGDHSASKGIGLYDKDELVSLIAYRKSGNGCDISRFCCKIGYSVSGALSKLLSEIVKKNPQYEFITSYVDLRYGNGNSLKKLGFVLPKKGITLGFKWTDMIKTYDRSHCMANMDERGLTERQHAKELNLYRIFDAGQAKFIKYLLTSPNNPIK
jgi:hypothetical protein